MAVALVTSGTIGPDLGRTADEFVSDTFAAAGLGSHWKQVLPHDAGTVQVAGSGGGERWLALSVPAGVNHNPWTVNDAVRATQRVRDGDLRVAAGFASMPFARYQMQGLMVAASESTFLRYEVRHDGAGLRLFAVQTVDGVPTVLADDRLRKLDRVYLRVERVRDDWTLSWSADRESWSVSARIGWSAGVTEVGPFAGNYDAAGNAPAFTALVDEVVNLAGPDHRAGADPGDAPASADTSPPELTGVAVHPRAGSARLSWVTGELTTGRVEYGQTDAYGERSHPTPVGFGHGVTLSGLEPGLEYHYRVVGTDLSGNDTVTGGGVFTTAAARAAGQFVPDDFAEPELAAHWRAVTPLGVGAVGRVAAGSEGGRLALSVPAGHSHDSWTVNNSVRAVQSVPDGDLDIEAAFGSVPDQPGQMQGLTVGESRLTFVRLGVQPDGSGLRLFGSVTAAGSPTVVLDTRLPALESVRLRVERERDDWVLSWSEGDAPWTEAAVFTHRMVVTEAGPFAGSHRPGGDAAAFTALVEHVRGTAAPAGGELVPAGPPEVQDLTVDATTNHVLLRWFTSAAAAARVEYGTDESYGDTAESTTGGTLHRVRLTGLALDTTYHYRVVATGPGGQTTRTQDRTFTTPAANTGPTIDVWYGPEQQVSPQAQVQQWMNVLGTVRDADGVAALSYSLNGGGTRPLSLGPDDRRLQWPGDFNADIPLDELRPGDNTVTLTATDQVGLVTTTTVTVTRGPGAGAPLPHRVRWRPGVSPAEQVQVVDGEWTVTDQGLRTHVTGYDRVVALGDIGWTDYEVTVPVTVHELGPEAYSFLSGGPVIGLGLRWQGHSEVDERQPAWGFYPTGAFAWYRFHEDGPRFELIGNEDSPRQFSAPAFELDTTYLLKVRVETLDDGVTRYQAKLWPADQAEPGFWVLVIEEDAGPAAGAVALIAHQLHGTFGDVTVRPL